MSHKYRAFDQQTTVNLRGILDARNMRVKRLAEEVDLDVNTLHRRAHSGGWLVRELAPIAAHLKVSLGFLAGTERDDLATTQRPDVATNERETLAEVLYLAEEGCTKANWVTESDYIRTLHLEMADAALAHLAATQRPDGHHAPCRFACKDCVECGGTGHPHDQRPDDREATLRRPFIIADTLDDHRPTYSDDRDFVTCSCPDGVLYDVTEWRTHVGRAAVVNLDEDASHYAALAAADGSPS